MVMSENQKAMTSIVTVLSSLQEEVRALSISAHKTQQQRIEIQVGGSKKDNNKDKDRDRDGGFDRIRRENGGSERSRNSADIQEISKV